MCFLEKLSEFVSKTELSTVLDLQLNAGFSWKMLKNNIWKFMMPIRRELVKDTLLLLAVTSLEGIRSDSESHWFITVKVGGISSLTVVADNVVVRFACSKLQLFPSI